MQIHQKINLAFSLTYLHDISYILMVEMKNQHLQIILIILHMKVQYFVHYYVLSQILNHYQEQKNSFDL